MTGTVHRFIHVSTDEVYGEIEADAIVGNHEALQLLPTNPYSATKAGAEMLVMAYGCSYGLPVITTRSNMDYVIWRKVCECVKNAFCMVLYFLRFS